MKFLSIILAITVLFLTFQPGLNSILSKYASGGSCCVETCTPLTAADTLPSEEPEGGCDGMNCNPFLSCGTCSVLCHNLPIKTFESPEISTDQVFSYSFSFSSPFTSDFWQPPKFV